MDHGTVHERRGSIECNSQELLPDFCLATMRHTWQRKELLMEIYRKQSFDVGLDETEDLLDRIEMWTVWRQEPVLMPIFVS
jgi:hypothetical protein